MDQPTAKSPRYRKLPQRLLLNSLFGLAVAVMIFVNYVSYRQLNKVSSANRWVTHTYQAMQSINNTFLGIMDMESLTRGYLITGDESYLNKLDEKINAVRASYALTNQLTLDNVFQQKRLKDLEVVLNERIEVMRKTIQLKKVSLLQTAEGIGWVHKGQAITNQIQEKVQNLYDNELSLLQQRSAETLSNFQQSVFFTTGTTTLNILFLLLIIYFFNRQLLFRARAEERWRESENLLKGIINGTDDIIAALDLNFRFIIFNSSFEKEFKRIFGKRVTLGMSMKDALAHLPEEQEKAVALWQRALNGEEFTVIGEFGDVALDRNQYEITYNSLFNEQGKIIGAAHIVRNIDKHLEEERAVRAAKEELEVAFAALKHHDQEISLVNEMDSALQTCLNIQETLEVIKRYCSRLLGFASGIVYFMHPSRNYLEAMIGWGSPQNNQQVISSDQCWALRQGKIFRYVNVDVSVACQHIEKEESLAPYICVPFLAHNEIVGLLYLEIDNVTAMDTTQIDKLVDTHELLINNLSGQIALSVSNMRLRDSLRARSIRDPLTGLYNRAYLQESLARDMQRAKRQNVSLAAVMMDLDFFKNVNDTYGHEAGDTVLREISLLLQKEVRSSDIVCRYGGEELLLILYETTAQEVVQRVEKIREKISHLEFRFGGNMPCTVTASFGIAMYPGAAEEMNELIEFADQALYHAKKSGRNKVTLYEENA